MHAKVQQMQDHDWLGQTNIQLQASAAILKGIERAFCYRTPPDDDDNNNNNNNNNNNRRYLLWRRLLLQEDSQSNNKNGINISHRSN
jgi:hypothetical protein